jgi:glycosyltransferase EpsF
MAGDTLYNGMNYENVVNPVDLSKYKDIERVSHEGISLLQIGYFCKRKNQIFSLSLLNELRQRGVNAHLSFVGYRHPNEPDYPEKMNEVITNYGLKESISILPHDYDKKSAFSEADYSLLPSESEGLPLVALESQAAGVVCLMSDNISEDSNVGAGFFLPYNDVKKWADAIVEGFNVDKDRLSRNLLNISTEAYMEKIKAHYDGAEKK